MCVNTAVGQINNSNVEFEELKKNAEIKEERKRRRRLRALTPKKTNPHQKSSIRLLYQQVSEDEQPESKVSIVKLMDNFCPCVMYVQLLNYKTYKYQFCIKIYMYNVEETILH